MTNSISKKKATAVKRIVAKGPSSHSIIFNVRKSQRVPLTGRPYIGQDYRRQVLGQGGVEDVSGAVPTIRNPSRVSDGWPQPAANLSLEEVAAKLDHEVSRLGVLQNVADLPPGNGSVVPDTSLYPWRVTAALVISLPNTGETYHGTGWLVGPHCFVTAGHVVYPRGPAYTGFASQIQVMPGLNGTGGPSAYPTMNAVRFACTQGWKDAGDPTCDYGVIMVDPDVGNTLGWLGASVLSDDDILGSVGNLSGYPAASPASAIPNGKQWYAAGQPDHLDAGFIYYNFGSLPGESGGALYRNVAGQSYVMGIHTAGSGNLGRSVRVTEAVAENLTRWSSST